MIIVWIALVLIVLILAAGLYFAHIIIHPKRYSLEESYAMELEKGKFNEAEYQSWEKQEVSITSPYGYTLKATYLPLKNALKTVICVHGITFTRMGSLKYCQPFRKSGYNILMVDNRYHGASGGANCTFGYFERYDLKAWTDWALQQLGPKGTIGLHGESMGAVISLLNGAIDPRLAFVVADCPFSSLWGELSYRMKVEYHLPPFPLLYLANLYCRIWTRGMRFDQVSPIDVVNRITAPVFFIHGAADSYILPKMSEEMFAARSTGYKKIYLAPDAEHSQSHETQPAEYDRQIEEFLKEIGA